MNRVSKANQEKYQRKFCSEQKSKSWKSRSSRAILNYSRRAIAMRLKKIRSLILRKKKLEYFRRKCAIYAKSEY